MAVSTETLEAFRDGDEQAFVTVMLACAPLMRSIVNRYWRSTFEREEALQEVWLHVHRRRDALDPNRFDKFEAWVSVLARSRCLDLLRKQGRQIQTDDGAELERLTDETRPEPSPEDSAVEAEIRDAAMAFAKGLDGDWRRFFELHFLSGLSHSEAAGKLGVRVSRTKYMKRIIVRKARRDPGLSAVLSRWSGDHDAS